jgi:hypothetical protein
VAVTYCIDYRVCCVLSARVNSNEDVTVGLYLHVQQVPRAYLPLIWTEPTYSQHSCCFPSYMTPCGIESNTRMCRRIQKGFLYAAKSAIISV